MREELAHFRNARHPRNQRHMRQHVVAGARPLFDQSVVAAPLAVIGEEEQGSVFGMARAVEGRQQFSQHPVGIRGARREKPKREL
jgi:hypothetical protein